MALSTSCRSTPQSARRSCHALPLLRRLQDGFLPTAAETRLPLINRAEVRRRCVCRRVTVAHDGRAAGEVAPAPSLRAPVQQLELDAAPRQPPFDWFSAWYPLAFTNDLDKSKLLRFVLLEIPLVIWWDPGAAAWCVFKDECPHRLVPLSEGRINKLGQLECGYHGWAFSGDGSCARIPQGGNTASPRACATPYPCEERQGLLFVFPQPLNLSKRDELGGPTAGSWPDPSLIITVPELDDPGWVPQDTWRDLPYDFSILLENVLDSSHVPFTHHASMSNRNIMNKYDMELLEPGVANHGFSGFWKDGPRAGSLGPQRTEFQPPCYMKHKLESAAVDSLVVVYAVPMSPGKCRLINRNVVRPKGSSSIVATIFRLLPRWMMHVGTHTLLEDDQIFLHYGEVEVAARKAKGQPMGQAYFTPSPADTYVLAFHRWLDKFGGGGPFGAIDLAYISRLGPRLSREQLLDRFSQHTATCAQCQRGMAQTASVAKTLLGVERALQAAALLCLAAAGAGVVLPSTSGQDAAAALSAGGPASGLAALLLSVLSLLLGSQPSPEQLVMRGAVWALAAWAAGQAATWASEFHNRFITGVYPPPRNAAKD